MRTLSPLLAVGLRAGAHLASPGGRHGSLLVLMYHRVLAASDPLLPDEPDAASFAAQIDLISSVCNVIGLTEAAERLATRSLPPRAAAITFDDGYANNVEIAAPILAARGLSATFFVATGFSDGGCMFNDIVVEAIRRARNVLDLSDHGLGRHELPDFDARRKAMNDILAKLKYFEPDNRRRVTESIAERAGLTGMPKLMMSERQVRELVALGMEVGGHSVTHPILTKVPRDKAWAEIEGCKRRLEEVLDSPVGSFAYPNGRPGEDYRAEHVGMVREAGYRVAVTTSWGAARRDWDVLQIPRIAPWDRAAIRYALRVMQTFRTDGLMVTE